jgi:hypothetical protein
MNIPDRNTVVYIPKTCVDVVAEVWWRAGGGAPGHRLLQPGPGLAPGSPGRDDATGGRLV